MRKVYWIPNLCVLLGVKLTPEVRSLLMSQWAWEGGNGGPGRNVHPSARFNWLNTMTKALGSTDFNSVGVQNFPAYLIGLWALRKTFKNPWYAGYLRALKSGTPLDERYRDGLTRGLSVWVTGETDSIVGKAYAERVIMKAEQDLPKYL